MLPLIFMAASAGASILGSLYNMNANENNYRIQQQRLQESRDLTLKQLNYQEGNILQDVQTAQAQIEANVSADYAARAQAGQTNYGLSQSLYDAQSEQLMTSANRQLYGVNQNRDSTFKSFEQQSSDMLAQFQANQTQQMFNMITTSLGSAAKIADYGDSINWDFGKKIENDSTQQSMNKFLGLSGDYNFKLDNIWNNQDFATFDYNFKL